MFGTLDLFFHWEVRAMLQATVLLNLNFWSLFLPFICVPFIRKYYKVSRKALKNFQICCIPVF